MCYFAETVVGGAFFHDNDDIATLEMPFSPVQPDGLADEAFHPVTPNSLPKSTTHRKPQAGMVRLVGVAKEDKSLRVLFPAPTVDCAELWRSTEMKMLRKGEISHGWRPKRTASFSLSGDGG